MSIVSSLTALQTAKSDIAAAITRKGIAVPAGDGFADYAAHIMAIAPDPLLVTAAEYIAQTRPSEWPDYTLVSLMGQEVCYLTYNYVHLAAWVPRHMSVIVTCTGDYTVSRGHIGTSGFVADETFTAASNDAVSLTGAQTGTADYVCYKIAGTTITAITLQNIALADGALLPSYGQNVVEVFARLPSVTSVTGLRANTIVLETLKDCISVTTLASAWYYCASLQSLDLSGWNTAEVTTLAYAWYYCASLQSLDLSGWNTAAVTTLANAWSFCTSLQALDLSGWNTAAVTTLANAWYFCASLQSLDLSGWNTAEVTTLAYAWYYCASLQSLDLSGWNTAEVTTLASAWYFCASLQSLDLSGWNTAAVTTLANAWAYCTSLQSLDLSGWNTSAVTTLASAWYFCASLQSLDLSSWNTAEVTTLASAWLVCQSLSVLFAPTHIRVSHDLSASTAYSVTTLVSWIAALDDLTGYTAQTLTLGATNLAKLSSAQKAVATGKNWTLA